MRVYSYDRVTHAYVSTVYADPDPMQPGLFLYPAYSTPIEPPEFVAGKVRVFNPQAEAWEMRDLPPEVMPDAVALSSDDRATVMRLAVGRYANSVAVGYGYDSIDEAVSYAEEPAVPQYQAEGRALRTWRSLLWAAFEQLLVQIANGEVDAPAGDVALFALLPQFTQADIDAAAAALAAGGGGGA